MKIRILTIFLLSFVFEFFKFGGIANSQIIPDPRVDELSRFNNGLVEGGARRGINLFHSFQEFNVSKDQSVYFFNPQGILNIISRVTGANSSDISGKIGVQGKANLFLINPNGITFGNSASLDVGGSFLVTTANAIQFGDKGFLEASSHDASPLLTVNPSGFLFTGTNGASINNRSVNGLIVLDKNSLVFLGGEVKIDNAGLYALGGQIEIGSVAGTGLVGLSLNEKQFSLNFPTSLDRGNIFLLNKATVDAGSSEFGSGGIQVIGKNIQIKDGSRIVSATTGQKNGAPLILNATNTIQLVGFTADGALSTITYDEGTAGKIEITTRKLIVQDEAQIFSATFGNGNGGDIKIKATESIELGGLNPFSNIVSNTFAAGKGGDIKIETSGNLLMTDYSFISVGAGSIDLPDGTKIPATGDSGNLTIEAGNSIQISGKSFLSADSTVGKAGKIKIDTNSLNIQNGGISVSSKTGKAGDLEINANSLILNRGELIANTGVSGANIKLTLSNLLQMEDESIISATANKNANGGNIKIDTPILVALPPTGLNGSDIRANAELGEGGNIQINTQGVFGIENRPATPGNRTNDIDARSRFGRSGQVQINTSTDVNQGLVELPTTVVDPNTSMSQQPCDRGWNSSFTLNGRGGVPQTPKQDLSPEAVQIGLVEAVPIEQKNATENSNQIIASQLLKNLQQPTERTVSPAQGWVYNNKGEVALVAYNPTLTAQQRLQQQPVCSASK